MSNFNLTRCVIRTSKNTITTGGFTVSDDGVNTQYGWTPPTWPAFDAAKEAFGKSILLAGVNTPPRPGTSPYTGYNTDPWGNTRNDIGAVYMLSAVPPVIDVQPQNQQVKIGGVLALSVTAHGTGTLHYQWKKDGSNVGTDASTYTKSGYVDADRGSYTVDVTDDVSTTTSDAATVKTLPNIITQPQTQQIKIGNTLTLEVIATGHSPLTYQWKKNGSNVGTNSSTYIKSGYTDADKGSYTVVVTSDGYTTTSDTAIITTKLSNNSGKNQFFFNRNII